MFLEIPDEDIDGTCQECGEDDNEDVLIFCDGCNKLWHTYCVGLDEVPYNSWFCEKCSEERVSDPQLRRARNHNSAPARRRTRGMERRRRNHNATHDDGWNQVWQTVWSSVNIDLDFPYEDDEHHAISLRRHRQAVERNRQEHEAWEARARIAELLGAGTSFRETESTLLDDSNHRRAGPHAPPPQSAEETAAWEAFAEATAQSEQPEASTARRRKRKSRTSSPTTPRERDSSSASPREPKRRRTSAARSATSTPAQRRIPLPARVPSQPPAQPRPPARPPRHLSPPRMVLDNTTPTFLQSLLSEVEKSASPSTLTLHRPSPRHPGSPGTEQHSPRPSSPATSNPSSPRALSATPPPVQAASRPNSPPGLSSSIQPVYPPYSPQQPTSPDIKPKPPEPLLHGSTTRNQHGETHIARPKPRRPRIPVIVDDDRQRTRSHDTSPTRTADYKADVQKLVSAALKPRYHKQEITKDEYTSINRDVSRMLYDKIGDLEALDLHAKTQWEKVAGEEVDKAVTALRASA